MTTKEVNEQDDKYLSWASTNYLFKLTKSIQSKLPDTLGLTLFKLNPEESLFSCDLWNAKTKNRWRKHKNSAISTTIPIKIIPTSKYEI